MGVAGDIKGFIFNIPNEYDIKEIGNKLEDFEILQKLGQGGNGYAIKVRSKKNYKIYVIKKSKTLTDEQKREIIILKKLDHPGICKCLNFFEENGFFYIIMELYNNKDLYRYVDGFLKMGQKIKEEKQNSDYVVVLMHWGREDSHVLEDVIKKDGKDYIDMGADLIVGSHAHVLQGMEIYKDKLIAYNLGDFLFSHVTDYTGILTLNLSNEGDMTYKFIPAYEKNYTTKLISGSEATKVYNLMTNWSINVKIDNNGNVVKR